MWSITSSMWDVTVSMCAITSSMPDVTASMHNAQALCELLHPLCGMLHTLCGLLQPIRMMYRRYVVYCILSVGCYSLYTCCTDFMWAVTGAAWLLQPTCILFSRYVGCYSLYVGRHWKRQGMKSGNEDGVRRKGANTGNEDR